MKAGHWGTIPHLELQILPSLNSKAVLQRIRLLFLLRQHWRAPSFSCATTFLYIDANIFPCAKLLASTKDFGCAKVLASAPKNAKDFGCAKVLASAKDFGCAKFLASAKDFEGANVFGCDNVFVYILWRLYFCIFLCFYI
jgi:hypothetical protein